MGRLVLFRSMRNIAAFPVAIQTAREAVRATIRAAAPEAGEKITYRLPAFAQHGNLISLAAWKEHIGRYPTGSGGGRVQG